MANRLEKSGFDGLVDSGVEVSGRDASHFAGEAKKTLHGHIRVEWSGFREIPDLSLGGDLIVLDIGSVDADFALGRGNVAGDHSHGGRFAGSVGTEKSEDFSFFHREGHAVHGYLASEMLVQIFDFYHR